MGLIQYEMDGKTRYIRDTHIAEFQFKYTILAHFCRDNGHSSRVLITLLERLGENPIDINWNVKLRQKVYRKETLELLSKSTY